MTTINPEFFRYCRSKGNSFGHSARLRDPVKAWRETKGFLDTFTEYKLTLPVEIELKPHESGFNSELLSRVIKQFGEPNITNEHCYYWSVETEFSEELLSIVLDNSKYEKVEYGPLTMRLYLNFYWKFMSKEVQNKFKGVFLHFSPRGYHGVLSVHISDRVFIQPEFVVPVENTKNLNKFVDELRTYLPFKFSDKSFISFYSKLLKNGKTKYKSIGYYNENS